MVGGMTERQTCKRQLVVPGRHTRIYMCVSVREM